MGGSWDWARLPNTTQLLLWWQDAREQLYSLLGEALAAAHTIPAPLDHYQHGCTAEDVDQDVCMHVPGVFHRGNIQKRLGQRPGHDEVGAHAVHCGVKLPVGVCTVSSRTAKGRHVDGVNWAAGDNPWAAADKPEPQAG